MCEGCPINADLDPNNPTLPYGGDDEVLASDFYLSLNPSSFGEEIIATFMHDEPDESKDKPYISEPATHEAKGLPETFLRKDSREYKILTAIAEDPARTLRLGELICARILRCDSPRSLDGMLYCQGFNIPDFKKDAREA